MNNNGYVKEESRPCSQNAEEQEDCILPVKSKNRKITDRYFIISFGLFLIVLITLVAYCMQYSDIYRIINGFDDCGFVCGRSNDKIFEEAKMKNGQCLDSNKTKYPYLLIEKKGKTEDPLKINKTCVKDCTEHSQRKFLTRCVPPNNSTSPKVFLKNLIISKAGVTGFFQELAEDFALCWQEIIYLAMMALVFSILYMVLMRYLAHVMVWVVLVGVVLASVGVTIFLWCTWWKQWQEVKEYALDEAPDTETRKSESYLAFSIIATMVSFGVISVVWAMRKRITLVIELFKEAGKAVAEMPLLFLLPLLTFVVVFLIATCWIYFIVTIESSGVLKTIGKDNQTKNAFVKTDGIIVTRWYNLFAFLWIFQFVLGCQQTVIGGAIGSWYFTRDKKNLKTPIRRSFHNLCRFHVGSIAYGSFLIAIIQFIRVVIKRLDKYLSAYQNPCITWTIKCCKCCLFIFNGVLKYLNRNAYIEIALYGDSFLEGGKKAYNVLSSNAVRIAAINSVGDSILFLGKVLVVMLTVLVGIEIIQKKEGLLHMWAPLALSGVFSYLISHCFLTVYEMAIDTVFVCFCEDCELNDGEMKPYYMSADFMQFVEKGKKTRSNKIGIWTTNLKKDEQSHENDAYNSLKNSTLCCSCWKKD